MKTSERTTAIGIAIRSICHVSLSVATFVIIDSSDIPALISYCIFVEVGIHTALHAKESYICTAF